jgi:uncharacterized protein
VRIVLDTNVLLSAMMTRGTPPNLLYEMWRDRRFDLVSCELQLDEVRAVSRRDALRSRLTRSEVGTLVNLICRLAIMVESFPDVVASPDPKDNYLLGLAQATKADLLVTGDKSHLLALKKHASTRIITARKAIQTL